MRRVLFVGQGVWANLLCEGLSAQGDGRIHCTAWPFTTPAGAISLRSFLSALQSDVIVRVGFRPGAHTPYGIGFDLLWQLLVSLNRKARLFVYWIGSDVLDTLTDVQGGKSTRRLRRILRRAHSIAGSQRLVDELAEADICAKHVPFPGGLIRAPENVAPLPDSFTVLSYIPDDRFHFYGGHDVLSAARSLPNVRFMIVGGYGRWARDVPFNVTFLGWRDDMPSLLQRSSAVIRLVEHDSVGGTAAEALLYARHLIYSYELPHSIHVKFGDRKALVAALAALDEAHNKGALMPNTTGREWALVEFDRKKRFDLLARTLLMDA